VKVCAECKKRKALTSFHRSSASPDGRKMVCGDCCNARTARYVAKYPEWKVRARAAWRKRNPDKIKAAVRRYKMIQREIKAGRMVRQPCEVCGDMRSQGHHDDYSKPLVVRWLCQAHHAEHHQKARRKAMR